MTITGCYQLNANKLRMIIIRALTCSLLLNVKGRDVSMRPIHPSLKTVKYREERLPPNSGCRSSLVPLKQIPRVHLVRHVRELVAPAVGDDHVAAGLEGLQVVGHLGAEELRRAQRGS